MPHYLLIASTLLLAALVSDLRLVEVDGDRRRSTKVKEKKCNVSAQPNSFTCAAAASTPDLGSSPPP
jgi:hypothetical protein